MFISLREDAEGALYKALTVLDLPVDELGIESPPSDVDAVLASNVAFGLASEVSRPPNEIATEIAGAIDVSGYEFLESVVPTGPYINFRASEAYYSATLEAAQASDYGRLPSTGERVVVEHTSANPTGPVHVGRARNPIIGDAIVRVLDYAGHDVVAHYYVNDAGRQMAVFTWAYETFDESDLPAPERDRDDYDLVRYYRAGNAYLEEGAPEAVAAAEAEIDTIIQGIESGDESVYERVDAVVDRVLGGMRESLGRLPVEFDEFVKETRFMRDGSTDAVVDRLREIPNATMDDGAWQLELSEWGIEKPFVFLRSDGTTLYTTRDLAHHEWKFENFDRAVTVLGEDQALHAKQLRAALELLDNDTDRLTEVLYGWVNLPHGSMSTRRGTGIDLDDLLDEAIARARDEVESRLDTRIRDDTLTDEDVARIARQVGIGAVRFDIVSKQPSKAITFEWERALDFEAQSAPYVQYVHARACGILAEAATDPPSTVESSLLTTTAERDLLSVIAHFPAVIQNAADALEPHAIAAYIRELGEAFNAFYRECPVLADDVDPALRDARLALVIASKHTVANALYVLGIEAPDSM